MGNVTRLPLSLPSALALLATAGVVGCVNGVDVAQGKGSGGSTGGDAATSGGALSTGGTDGGTADQTPTGGTGASGTGGFATSGGTSSTGGADTTTGGKTGGAGGKDTTTGGSNTGGKDTTTGGSNMGGAGGAGGTAAGSTGGSTTNTGGQGDGLDCSGFFIPPDHLNATTTYEFSVDTVTDLETGLMWQRKIDASKKRSLLGQPTCTDPALAGFSDWRLPTVLELATIIDFGGQVPTIASPTFPDTPADYFGTSTGLFMGGKQSTYNWWSVNFETGLTLNGSPEGYVRCVRRQHDRNCFSGPRFEALPKASTENGTATVVDKMFGIGWQRDASVDPLTWESAKQYCNAFDRGAHLPTAKELLSIVEWGAAEAINLDAFPNAAGGDYWTSTALPGSTTEALTIRFGDATYTGTGSAPITETHHVRCVLGT